MSMANSNGSIVDYSSEIETVKKVVKHESGYSSYEEETDFKVEVDIASERSEDDWVKPNNGRKASIETPDKRHLCGRLSVVAIHSPRHHQSDGGASSSEVSPGGNRSCTQCGATKTPLWRNGPYGPKSLCNACGIRYKKVGSSSNRRGSNNNNNNSNSNNNNNNVSGEAAHESSSHHSGKASSKSLKRRGEPDLCSERAASHRRGKLLVREKREPEDAKSQQCSSSGNYITNNSHNNSGSNIINNNSSSNIHNNTNTNSSNTNNNNNSNSSSRSGQQLSPPVSTNIPRRVCTRRSLPSFHSTKWGARSARLHSGFRKSQTKDEEEGAALLMALACGLVNA